MNKRNFSSIVIGYVLFAVFSTASFAQQSHHCSVNSDSACTANKACSVLNADEATAKAAVLSYDDSEWKSVLCALSREAASKKDFGFVAEKAKALLSFSTKDDIKLFARFALGRAYCSSGKFDEAKAEFKKIADEHPKSACAEEAECCIQQIECAKKCAVSSN